MTGGGIPRAARAPPGITDGGIPRAARARRSQLPGQPAAQLPMLFPAASSLGGSGGPEPRSMQKSADGKNI